MIHLHQQVCERNRSSILHQEWRGNKQEKKTSKVVSMSKKMMKNKMIFSFNKYNKETKLVRKDNRILADKKPIKVGEEQLANLINHNHLMMI